MKKIVVLIFLISSLLFSAEDINITIDYDKSTTCLVRNLKLYKSPKWVSKIDIKNGKVAYFCSPKSMFEFYFQPEKWQDIGATSRDDFKRVVVTDYNTLKPIDAKGAFFVYGSRVISPAGDDLVAFKTKEEAEEFVKREGGSRVFPFDKVPFGLIKLLNNSI